MSARVPTGRWDSSASHSTISAHPGTIGIVELTATATLWCLFSCFLLFPRMGLPPLMHRTAMTLLVAELVALGVWSYGSEGCPERPCGAGAELGRTAAALDVPLLAAALVALAMIRGMRTMRNSQRAAR
jgi:hypothetical protein